MFNNGNNGMWVVRLLIPANKDQITVPPNESASVSFFVWITRFCLSQVAYLCKMAPVAKLKCALFLKISMLDIGTILPKINHEENKCFGM